MFDNTKGRESTPELQRIPRPGEVDGTSARAGAAPASQPGTPVIVEDSKHKKKKSSGFLARSARSVTKGPRLLGRRIKHFLRDDLHVSIGYKKLPKGLRKELATQEILAAYHRWLRGVQAVLAIAVFVLSLMTIEETATIINAIILVLSIATQLVITKVYEVKAQFSGITNVLFEGRNVFTSPFFFHMALECVVWSIQTPPIIVFWKPFFNLLNYFMFIRLYSVVLYLNNATYAYRTFCRAISAISDLPLNTSFLIRTSLVFHKTRVLSALVAGAWLTVAAMYMKAESVPFSDALWFSFQTLATLGYGDVTPNTVSGRAVVFISWAGSVFLMAYLVVTAHFLLLSSDQDFNMQVLSRCHELTHTLEYRSAWAIKVAWKLHRARRVGATPTFKERANIWFLSWKLTYVVAAMRRTRQHRSAVLREFRETNVNPLSGLTAQQYGQYVFESHRAARKLQRIKDVDRVFLALRDRNISASSLTRKDIESIIIPEAGTGSPEEELSVSAAAWAAPAFHASSRRNSTRASPTSSPMLPATTASVVAPPMDVDGFSRKVQMLEHKCTRLGELIDALSVVSATQPPSMAQSQFDA